MLVLYISHLACITFQLVDSSSAVGFSYVIEMKSLSLGEADDDQRISVLSCSEHLERSISMQVWE